MLGMIRLRAVRSLLLEEIAELEPPGAAGEERATIAKARARAGIVTAIDLIAILILFIFRPQATSFLDLGASEQGLFTLGVLAIAVHAGYRLGQMQKLGAVLRALGTLPGSDDSEI